MSLTGRMGDDLENINQWVKEATEGKIENFLLELPQDTVLLLLNAIYFQGASLAQPYPPLTWRPAEAAPALFPALFSVPRFVPYSVPGSIQCSIPRVFLPPHIQTVRQGDLKELAGCCGGSSFMELSLKRLKRFLRA